jgi:DNA-3-methyladenine glycosylase
MVLPRSFYNQPTLKVAQELLGCFLVRQINKKIIKAKIVETEAYNGPKDKASHASRGKTERNQVMFGPPGIIYIYFTYGMHYMMNIVTEEVNYPAAILIRAVEPVTKNIQKATNGPARLTKALKIDKKFNDLPIYKKDYGLFVENKKQELSASRIISKERIGISYAEEYRYKKWRYYIKGNNYISKK